jgi:hypothetical protein
MNFDPGVPISPWAVAGILVVLAAIVAAVAFAAWMVVRKW